MLTERQALVQVVQEVLCPLVHADGGTVYLAFVGDMNLHLHLTGQYSGCPGNALVQRGIIEPLLTGIMPGIRVDVSSGPLVPKGAERI